MLPDFQISVKLGRASWKILRCGLEINPYIAHGNDTAYIVMVSEDIRDMIPSIRQYLGHQPVRKAWLYGSCSRGEETADSDIDILVEYDRRSGSISLMKIAGIMLGLEDMLHRRVDLVEADRLLPFARESAYRDRLLIYERKG